MLQILTAEINDTMYIVFYRKERKKNKKQR